MLVSGFTEGDEVLDLDLGSNRYNESMLSDIKYYKTLDPEIHVLECEAKGCWTFYVTHNAVTHVNVFHGLDEKELLKYVDSELASPEILLFKGIADGVLGESLELRKELDETMIAYAERANRAVVRAIERKEKDNESLAITQSERTDQSEAE